MGEELTNPYIATLDRLPVQKYFVPEQNIPHDNDYNAMNEAMREPEQPKLYQPPVNPIYDYGASNAEIKTQAQPQVQAQPVKTPEQTVKELFSEMPQPTYDKERQERLKTISKAEALGEGLRTLGDVFALSKGANVTPRGPNMDVRRNLASWQNYEDNYNMRKDEYNRQAFNQKLQALYRGEDIAFRNKRADLEDKRYDTQIKEKRLDREQAQKNVDWSHKMTEKQFEEQVRRGNRDFIESQKRFAAQQGLHWESLNLQKQKNLYDMQNDMMMYQKRLQDLDKDSFYLMDDKGNKIGKINQNNGELEKVFAMLMKDPAVSGEIDALESAMGGKISPTNQKYLVAKYGPDNQAVRNYLGYGPPGTNYTPEQIEAVKQNVLGYSTKPYSWDVPTTNGTASPAPAQSQPSQKQSKTNWDNYEVN